MIDVFTINFIALTRVLKELIVAQRVIRINELATTPAKAGKLPVSPATIWRWVREGKFPNRSNSANRSRSGTSHRSKPSWRNARRNPPSDAG